MADVKRYQDLKVTMTRLLFSMATLLLASGEMVVIYGRKHCGVASPAWSSGRDPEELGQGT